MIRSIIKTVALAAFLVSSVEASGSWAASAEVIEGQKKAASEAKPTLPRRLNDYTILIDITASNEMLIETYLVESHKKNVPADFIDLVRKNVVSGACKRDALKKAMALGAVYRYVYFDETPKSLGSFNVAQADCTP